MALGDTDAASTLAIAIDQTSVGEGHTTPAYVFSLVLNSILVRLELASFTVREGRNTAQDQTKRAITALILALWLQVGLVQVALLRKVRELVAFGTDWGGT